jgi:tetratricopeptide (TPR) repeat protein
MRAGAPEYRLALARTRLHLGSLLWRTGRAGNNAERAEQGEKTLREARAGCAALADEFRNVPEYRQELARCLTSLGLQLQEARRGDEAEAACREALTLRERLVAECPAVPGYRQELARTQTLLGRVWREAGRRAEADQLLQEALTCKRQLVESYLGVPAYRHDLGNSLLQVGLSLREQGDLEQARRHLEQAVEQHRAALESNRRQPAFRRALLRGYEGLGGPLFQSRDHAGLVRVAEEVRTGLLSGADGHYHAARLLARAVLLVQRDTQLPEEQRQARARAYGDRAVELLQEAIRKGYEDGARSKNDGHFRALRSRDDFEAVLAKLPAAG